ncbi:MAG: DNA-3-methyladenine glycosylase [Blastocatellia bacterium]|nr:DNA-3-methyladenine glycosylase [Blastocatellia bacterium]
MSPAATFVSGMSPQGRKLPRAFYARPTVEVAQELLGKYLVHHTADGPIVGRIVETEAYVGPEDRASHAWRGLTPRTAVMFGPPGYAYVYLIYGVHHCLNIVTEREGYPAAVLIRALDPLVSGVENALVMPNGPGKVCRYLAIDRTFNGIDLCGSVLYVEDRGDAIAPDQIVATPRVGVDYAGPWSERLWRFYIRGNPFVSRPGRSSSSRR